MRALWGGGLVNSIRSPRKDTETCPLDLAMLGRTWWPQSGWFFPSHARCIHTPRPLQMLLPTSGISLSILFLENLNSPFNVSMFIQPTITCENVYKVKDIVLVSFKCHFHHEADPMLMGSPLSPAVIELCTRDSAFQPQPTQIWLAVYSLSLK